MGLESAGVHWQLRAAFWSNWSRTWQLCLRFSISQTNDRDRPCELNRQHNYNCGSSSSGIDWRFHTLVLLFCCTSYKSHLGITWVRKPVPGYAKASDRLLCYMPIEIHVSLSSSFLCSHYCITVLLYCYRYTVSSRSSTSSRTRRCYASSWTIRRGGNSTYQRSLYATWSRN